MILTRAINYLYTFFRNNPSYERGLRRYINRILDLQEHLFHKYPRECLEIKSRKIKRILLLSYGGTGDIALFSSFTSYLKRKYPFARITNLVNNNQNVKYIASLDPNVDKVIGINLPRFFNFKLLRRIKNKYKYDLFIYLHFYPDLRYLMPNVKAIHMPFFIYRDIPMQTPVPRLVLDFRAKYKNHIFLNCDMLTFNFSSSYLSQMETNRLLTFLCSQFPEITFVVNDFEKRIKIKSKNLILFRGGYKNLLKFAVTSRLFISFRNGLCDVVAASTKNKKMLIVYPDQNYPGKWGVPFIRAFGMKEIGYPNSIAEYVFNKNKDRNLSRLKTQIKNFIINNYEK